MRSARIPALAAPALASLLSLLGCGSRPADVLPPLPVPELADPAAEHPRLKLGDGTVTANDRCPVTKRKLSVHFPPVYVNGQAIGFC